MNHLLSAASSACPTPPLRVSLSAKLLALTLLFVALAEILIFVPSIAQFRENWLKDRISAAKTAALVLEAAPDGLISRALELDVLAHVGAMTLSLKRDGARYLLAVSSMPPEDAVLVDLRQVSMSQSISEAFDSLLSSQPRTLRILDHATHVPRAVSADFIEITISEAGLRRAMLRFSRQIFLASLVMSAIVASLLYLALTALFVRPMRRLSDAMVAYRLAPEDRAHIIIPSKRCDEVGRAEKELAQLQVQLQATLHQKSRLAALGLAVAKINHDLRNILASVQLFADRLALSPDPLVQRLMPKVLRTLDRGILLCEDTLIYGHTREPHPQCALILLHPLVEEVAGVLGLMPPHADAPALNPPHEATIYLHNLVPSTLHIHADVDQIFRVLLNLMRNSVQALEALPLTAKREIRVEAWQKKQENQEPPDESIIEVSDTGSGIPLHAQSTLFEAFSSSTRGGAGLGLAIVFELIRAHKGRIELINQEEGTCFRMTLPFLS